MLFNDQNLSNQFFRVNLVAGSCKEQFSRHSVNPLHITWLSVQSKDTYFWYCLFILTHFVYCAEVWGNTYVTNTQPLHVLQKKAIRFINKVDVREHSGRPESRVCVLLRSLKSISIIIIAECELRVGSVSSYRVVRIWVCALTEWMLNRLYSVRTWKYFEITIWRLPFTCTFSQVK